MYGAALKSQETRRIKKPDKGDLAGSKSFLLQVSEREAEKEKEKEREAGNSPSEAGDYERGMSSREASPSTQNNAAEDKGQKAFATATKMRSVIGAFAADQKGSAARKKWLSAITKVNAARAFKSKSRVIDPQSTGRVTWDLVLGIPILYSVLIIPYRLGFDHEATGFFYWLDISIDCMFGIDIILNFMTGYYDDQELLVTDVGLIAKNYVRGWFPIDFVSTVPFDLLAEVVLGSSGSSAFKIIKIIRLLRLLKLARLKKLAKIVNDIEEAINMNAAMVRLLRLLFNIVFVSHMLACMWYAISTLKDYEDNNWVSNYGLEGKTFRTKYLASFYWTIATMTAVGYGDVVAVNDAERMYSIFTQLVGSSIFGFLIGNIATLIDTIDIQGGAIKRKMQNMKDYMTDRKLPRELQTRIRKYYQYYLQRISVFDEQGIMRELSSNLRDKVSMEANKSIVSTMTLFKDMDSVFISSIVINLRPFFALPGDVVAKEGEMGVEMYFLYDGMVELNMRRGKKMIIIGFLDKGEHFGEMSLLKGAVRKVGLRATTYCEIFSLSKYDLEEALQFNPEALERMLKISDERGNSLDQIMNSIESGEETCEEMESRGEGSGDDDEEEKVEDKASGDSPQPKSIYSPNKGGPRHTAIEAPEPMTIMWVLKHVCQMNLGKALADRREKIRRHAAATSASSKDLIYEMAKFIVMPNGELMPGLDMKSMSFSEQKLHDEHAHQTVKTRRLVRFDPNTGQADVPISRAETMRRLSSFNVGREGDSLSPSASVSAPQTPMAGPTPSMLQTASMLQREMRPSLETAAQATGLTQEAIEKALKKGKKIFMPQETEETEKSLYKRYIIPPDSDLKTRINLIVAFLILYSVISTPFRLGFDYPATGGWYVFDWMCDIGFFIDIAVNFRTAFVDVSGVVETVPNAIANNYLKGWFTIDFVSTVPIDFVIGQLVGGGGQTLRALKLVRILRLVRLLKLARLGKLVSVLEEDYNISPVLLRYMGLLVQVYFIAHLLACFWFYVTLSGMQESHATPSKVEYCSDDAVRCVWWVEDGLVTESLATKYVASLYWSFTTMTTVGYGDIIAGSDAELLYSSFAMLLGVTVFGYIVGSVVSLVARMSETTQRQKERLQEVKNYMNEKNLNGNLQRRVKKYYEHYLSQRSAFAEDNILDELTARLKNEVLLYVNRETVKNITFFGNLDEEFISHVVQIMKMQFYVPGDYVFREGEYGKEMYFVVRGTVEHVLKPNTEEEKLEHVSSEGDSFGDLAALATTRRYETARTKLHSALFVLHQDSITHMMNLNPQLASKLEQLIMADYATGERTETEDVGYPTDPKDKGALLWYLHLDRDGVEPVSELRNVMESMYVPARGDNRGAIMKAVHRTPSPPQPPAEVTKLPGSVSTPPEDTASHAIDNISGSSGEGGVEGGSDSGVNSA